jgi:hypothetical protein
MATIKVTTKDGEPLVFEIESDPNWVADYEYQDEDGNWTSNDEEEEQA